MGGNKGIRNRMIKKYGKVCMIEAAGIRFIPMEKRRKIKGYRKSQDQLQYHHIREESKGGDRTESNGAIVKGYNHEWLHSLPKDKKEEVNRALQEYKINLIKMQGDNMEAVGQLELDMNNCIEIQAYDTTEVDRKKFNRAKVKRQTKREIDRYYQGRSDLEDDYSDR